jgi:hypothetical protein
MTDLARSQYLAATLGTNGRPNATVEDEVVDIAATARLLRTSVDSLHRKWKKLPFAFKDPIDGRLKFRRSGIERYVAQRASGHLS